MDDEKTYFEAVRRTLEYVKFDPRIVEELALTSGLNQHYEIFEWIWFLPQFNDQQRREVWNNLHTHAIKNGIIPLLDKLHTLNIHVHHVQPYSNEEISFSISVGNPAVTTWLLDHNYCVTKRAFVLAGEKQDIPLLERLFAKRPHLNDNPNIICYGIINKNMTLIHWALNHGCRITEYDLSSACYYGFFDLLLLKSHDCRVPNDCTYNAALKGHFEILKWLRNQNCDWDYRVVIAAIDYGNLDYLKWIIQNGCPFDPLTITNHAALFGHLHILKWARELNYAWGYSSIEQAARHGYFHIVKWAFENGYAFDLKILMYHTIENGHLDMLKWTYATFQNITVPDVAKMASFYKKWTMLHWLLENGHDTIESHSHEDVPRDYYLSAKYLHDKHGWFTDFSDYFACVDDSLSMVFYDDLSYLIKSYM